MFLGVYEYRIDQKDRVTIPPRFRDEYHNGIIITRGYDRCVVAYTVTQWDQISQQYAALPTTSSSSRLVNRLLFSSAFNLTLDRLGRLHLPPPLKAYSQIEEDVVIAGVGNYIEIWSKESWEREQEAMEQKAAEIAENLGGGTG